MHYVIVGDGSFLHPELLADITAHKQIVALDHAAITLIQSGLRPHVVIGDCDSLTSSELAFLQSQEDIAVMIDPHQDTTDLQKGIHYCDAHQAHAIEIVCAIGDRLDHSLFNIRLLRRYYRETRPLLLHHQKQTLSYVKDARIELQGEKGDACGIFAFPKASFTSTGLAYDGKAYPLAFAETDSVANYFTENIVSIEIKGEALIIAPGYYQKQRNN
ncbi:MAG: hypothetical protein K0R12_416 [Gammaproteobacteria bacterium]|nr:hypothetical protein [Gammaproteobacteria bacterium]